MRSSRRPPRPRGARRPMERNAVAWTMVHALRLDPTEPAWKNAQALSDRRRPRRHQS